MRYEPKNLYLNFGFIVFAEIDLTLKIFILRCENFRWFLRGLLVKYKFYGPKF